MTGTKMKKLLLALLLAPLCALAQNNTLRVEWTLAPCESATCVFATQTACDDAVKALALTSEKVYACPRTVRATPPAPVQPAAWVKCADERAQCSFAGTYRVRYGDGIVPWVLKTFTNGTPCTNAAFGNDPAVGKTKRCEREASPVPTTPTVPVPPTEPTVPPSTGGTVKPGDFGPLVASGPVTLTSGQSIKGRKITNPTGDCVTVNGNNVSVLENEIGPCGGKGVNVKPGSFNVAVQRNYIHDISSSIYAEPGAINPIDFQFNWVTNIKGPMPRGQMAQYNGVRGGTRPSKITCNVSDQTGTYHNVEDHINMFASSGLSKSAPIEIAYNKLRGGSPTSNSGTGVIAGDGASNDSEGNYFWIHDNIVVNVRNVGIAVAGGKDSVIENNRVFMRMPEAQFVNQGYYVWNQYAASCYGHSFKNNLANTSSGSWWNSGNCGPVVEVGNDFSNRTLTAAIFDEVIPQCQ